MLDWVKIAHCCLNNCHEPIVSHLKSICQLVVFQEAGNGCCNSIDNVESMRPCLCEKILP